MNLKSLRFVLPVLASFCLSASLSAQCFWRLDMFDLAGDGWDGGSLTITSGTFTQTYSLGGFPNNGIDSTVYFPVQHNQPITFIWSEGFFDGEVAFSVFNTDGALVVTIAAPSAGEVYAGTSVCPDCVAPLNVQIENIYDKRVKLRWSPGIGVQMPVGWWVIYGPEGFVPAPGIGDTLYVNLPKATITGLLPKTKYTFYVFQDCGNGLIGDKVGPFNFETYWSNDVSVTGVLSPQSACDLGVETIEFAMSNPGANPQSLIPYNFFVNGMPGGVSQPEDGYYTGVIGKDSTEIIEFETTYDFGDPGEYELMVFTGLEGDEDPTNDTLRYYFNNILVPPYAQSFERWNGGWTVVNDLNSFGAPSWEYGAPSAPIINAAGDGEKAWVTNLDGFFNFGERSYIQSSCFDFSGITQKPALEFLVNYSCSPGNDGLIVEYSIDEGANWVRIGTSTTGMNWYNSFDPTTGDITAWAGDSEGWLPTHHLVNNVAGQSNVIFRFGFSGFSFNSEEGAGIDNFKVFVPADKDFAAARVTTLGESVDCGLAADKVTFNVVNVGSAALSPGYKLFYSVNGGTPVTYMPTSNILIPDENLTHTFSATFDSRDVVSVIKCWVVADGDTNPLNDTVTYTISHLPAAVPFREDFEGSFDFPEKWLVTSNTFITTSHGNVSNVAASNLYSFNPSLSITSPRFGTIGANDSLRFDYRLIDYLTESPLSLVGNTSKIEVRISEDCGQNFQTVYTVNNLTHIVNFDMQTRKISLANYAGKNIIVQFIGTWGAGDFWVDLDNIGIISCPSDMQLSANVNAATPGQNNGSASVNVGLGNPPYQYNWSTGATTAMVTGLGVGNYAVTVIDDAGCSDTLSITVGTSSTGDLPALSHLSIKPNPTSGWLMLDIDFQTDVYLQVNVFNLLGQSVYENNAGNANSLHDQIDLSAQPAGIYLMKITANGEVTSRKIVKN